MQLSFDIARRRRDRLKFWKRKSARDFSRREKSSRTPERYSDVVYNFTDQSSEGSYFSAISNYPRNSVNTEVICNMLERFTQDGSSPKGFQYSIVSLNAMLDFPKTVDVTLFPSIALYGTPASQEEKISALASSLCGNWVTMLERSNSIDEQFKFMGISSWKRSILNKLSLSLTMFLEGYDENQGYSVIHTWLHTPLGLRHMRWFMNGEESSDSDADAGTWIGSIRVTELTLEQVGTSVLALQRIMRRPDKGSTGITIETRCVLPDVQNERIMLYQIDTFPNALSECPCKGSFHTTRVLKFNGAVENSEVHTALAATERGCWVKH